MTENVIVPGQRLGRNPRKPTDKVLKLASYLPVSLPVPNSADFTGLVSNWPIDGNDQYGDCTCAAVAHGAQVFSALAGAPYTPDANAAEQLYFDVNNGGQSFPPGAPQDQGSDLVTVLNAWKVRKVFGPVLPYAWVDVDTSANDHLKIALSLFGGLDLAVGLPLTAQSQDVWDVTPNWQNDPHGQPGSWGGHAIWAVAFDAQYITVVTWGTLKKMTWAFWAGYREEAIAVLPTDWQQNAKFDFNKLQQDLHSLGQS